MVKLPHNNQGEFYNRELKMTTKRAEGGKGLNCDGVNSSRIDEEHSCTDLTFYFLATAVSTIYRLAQLPRRGNRATGNRYAIKWAISVY